MKNTLGIIDFPLTHVILGVDIYNSLKDVIDFFKPYRVRIKDFITSFKINDPLADFTALEDFMSIDVINEIFFDRGVFNDYNLDFSGHVIDNLKDQVLTTITTSETPISSNLIPNQPEVSLSKLFSTSRIYKWSLKEHLQPGKTYKIYFKISNSSNKDSNNLLLKVESSLQTQNSDLIFHFGDENGYNNKIMYTIPLPEKLKDLSIPFSSNLIGNILKENKDSTSTQVSIFEKGLMKMEFKIGDIESTYYIVRLEINN
jgi:hypothetical protein